jgi:hypothetical protein
MGEEQGELNATTRHAIRQFESDDDLQALEKRIGRFNIFDSLRIAKRELQHSNFLGWLLDPAESHGLGDIFQRAFLADISSRSPTEFAMLGAPGSEEPWLQRIEVRREWQNIDHRPWKKRGLARCD